MEGVVDWEWLSFLLKRRPFGFECFDPYPFSRTATIGPFLGNALIMELGRVLKLGLEVFLKNTLVLLPASINLEKERNDKFSKKITLQTYRSKQNSPGLFIVWLTASHNPLMKSSDI